MKGSEYLIVVDNYYRYIKVKKLLSTNTAAVIMSFKAIFSQHGIPSVVVSDNGPQFTSKEMDFAKVYGFRQINYYKQPILPSS